ncbi:tropomyosin-1-like [Pocillopora damicornis]|uniref:tropomyosin-1-like n=1 Tax=Pocillopora damicornis TaxID=46731 RepID=UPI000F552F0C|nr:tropomyosin-1-like [Pocillopora damicornis]
MASCKKKYSELRTNRKEKLSSPKKELSSNDSDVPLSNNNLISKCNDLEQANKDLRDLIESKKSSIHTALTTIQDVQLTVKEARKRLETETGAMKIELVKLRAEHVQNYKQCNVSRIQEEKYYINAANVDKIKKLRREQPTSLEKNQLKEDLESEIAQLTRELEEKEEAIPNSFETEQKFKMKKTETYRTMKELFEREKEIARKGRLLKASKHEINAELELLPVECKDMERGVAERERQFSIWRVEAKMELNEKDNELEDLKTQICELKESLKSQVLPPKESNRSAKHFIPRLRRRR